MEHDGGVLSAAILRGTMISRVLCPPCDALRGASKPPAGATWDLVSKVGLEGVHC